MLPGNIPIFISNAPKSFHIHIPIRWIMWVAWGVIWCTIQNSIIPYIIHKPVMKRSPIWLSYETIMWMPDIYDNYIQFFIYIIPLATIINSPITIIWLCRISCNSYCSLCISFWTNINSKTTKSKFNFFIISSPN